MASGIGVNFLGNMGGLAGGPVLVPPDTDGSVGPNDFVEFTNGCVHRVQQDRGYATRRDRRHLLE